MYSGLTTLYHKSTNPHIMKTYSRILGVLNLVIVLSAIVFLIFVSVEGSSNDRVVSVALFIPVFLLLHFLILNKFGFNYNDESKDKYRNVLRVSSLLTLTLFFFPLRYVYETYKENDRIEELSNKFKVSQDWGKATTAYQGTGGLKTKYIDGNMHYLLQVTSKKLLEKGLYGVTLKLLDEDGFLIEETYITEYTIVTDDGTPLGINVNSSIGMSVDDYSKIGGYGISVSTNKD